MTNKDLNLALDQNLIQPEETQQSSVQEQPTRLHPNHNRNHEAANFDTSKNDSSNSDSPNINSLETNPGIMSSSTMESSYGYQSKSGRYRKGSSSLLTTWISTLKNRTFPWLSIGIISINLIFLLLVGLWLLNQNHSSTEITSSKAKLAGLSTAPNESINQQLTALQTKMEQIELTLHEQQRLIATSSQDLNQKIQQLGTQVEAIKTPKTKKEPPKATPPPPKTVIKQPKTQWYVNIGTFSSKDAAQRLKKQLLTLGHTVQINTTSFDNKPAYRVQLPGFKDRESAENTARQIMNKTNLNGLWAWKDE